MIGDYKKDIKIDESNLEMEWLEQPAYYLYYAEAHSDALYERDLAKSKVDYKYAMLYTDVKQNWEKHFDSKPTEPAIKEFILSNSEFREEERKYLEACRTANTLAAAKTAFDHRKRALENLVSLKISGFYAEPRNKQRRIKSSKDKEKVHKSQKEELNTEDSRVSSRIKRNRRK